MPGLDGHVVGGRCRRRSLHGGLGSVRRPQALQDMPRQRRDLDIPRLVTLGPRVRGAGIGMHRAREHHLPAVGADVDVSGELAAGVAHRLAAEIVEVIRPRPPGQRGDRPRQTELRGVRPRVHVDHDYPAGFAGTQADVALRRPGKCILQRFARCGLPALEDWLLARQWRKRPAQVVPATDVFDQWIVRARCRRRNRSQNFSFKIGII